MSIKGFDKSKLRSVSGITKQQHDLIFAFLQGAVYVWCKLNPNEWFALRDLMGRGTSDNPTDDGNFFWNGTPMYDLWLKHKNPNDDSAEHISYALRQAAIDGGWILKEVLAHDKREFDIRESYRTNQYRWIGGKEDIEPQEDKAKSVD